MLKITAGILQAILMLCFFFVIIIFPIKHKKDLYETKFIIYISALLCAINILNLIVRLT